MIDPRDYEDLELTRIYKEGAWPEPRRQIDEAILAASRRAGDLRLRRAGMFVRRWAAPVAFAATVVLTFTLLLMMSEEKPVDEIEMFSPPVADVRPAPRAEAPAAARAEPPAPEPKPAVEPKPQPAPRSATAAKPAPAPRPAPVPRVAPVQRPVPASPAFALKKEAADAARADRTRRELQRLEEIRKAREAPPPSALAQPREPQPQIDLADPLRSAQPARESAASPAAAAAPPASAGVLSGGSAAAQSPTGVRGQAPGGYERSPETWLEDIRRLKLQGRGDDAERELAEFKRRYPAYSLPEDLR